MINLLPTEQKSKVAKKRGERATSVLVFFLVSFLLILSVTTFIVRAFGLSVLEKESALIMEEKAKFSNVQEKEEIIDNFNTTVLSVTSLEEERIDFPKIITDIYDLIPRGVKIKKIEFDRSHPTAGEDTLILSGIADSWDLLLSVEGALEENYSEVNFSPGSWSSTRDIEFFVNFKMDEENE